MHKPAPKVLPGIIQSRLAAFSRRRALVSLWRGAAESLALLCGGVLLLMLLHWLTRPSLPWRILLSAANYLGACSWLTFRALVPALRRASLANLARDIERAANGAFDERLSSAVELAQSGIEPGVSTWMKSETIRAAAEQIQKVEPAALVQSGPASRVTRYAAALVLLLLGLMCLVPGVTPRVLLALNPRASVAPLSLARLAVAPGNCRLRQGSALEIRVSANVGLDSAKALIRWQDGFEESVPMSRVATNGFALNIPALTQGLRYALQAGDAESGPYLVRLDVPPRIARAQLEIQPPSYTGQTNRIVEGGTADFIEGSRVRLTFFPNGESAVKAVWYTEDSAPRPLMPLNDAFTLELQPTNTITYQVRLHGRNGLDSEPSPRWVLRPIPDLPPAARLVIPGAEAGLVQREELLRLEPDARDDVGLKRVELIVVNSDAETDLKTLFPDAAPPPRPPTSFARPLTYNLADLTLLSGNDVQFHLVATDLRGQVTRSDPVNLTIGAEQKSAEAQLAVRLKNLLSALDSQTEHLQQTRASWQAIGRNYREEDPDAQRPALAVVESRLADFSRGVATIGEALVAESETNEVAEARFLYRLGTTMSGWGGQQARVIVQQCRRLAGARGTNIYSAFSQSRELVSRALRDLEQYRRAIAVLQGFYQADVLSAQCEGAQGRYKRGLPVLRGQAPPSANTAAGPGLLATFFEGIDLSGNILDQKVTAPDFQNYTAGNRRENWSARYLGEVNIPESGEWSVGCLADDGVRLILDGKSLLPANAWSSHAATQYKAEVELQAGWHRVEIDFFQGSSESRLEFQAARKGRPLGAVPADWLRPALPKLPALDPSTNAALTLVLEDALKRRMKNSLGIPAAAPGSVASITNDVRIENLSRIIAEHLPTAGSLTTNLLSFSSWRPEDFLTAESQADTLTGFSKEAARLLREELERFRWRYEGASALSDIKTALDELREVNREFRELPQNMRPERTEDERTKLSLARAWQSELARATTEATRRFFETARQPDATLAERALALNAAATAQKALQPEADNLARTLGQPLQKNELARQVEHDLQTLEDRYRQLNTMQEKINREHIAAEARRAYPAARSFARAQQAVPDANLAKKHTAMRQGVERVQQAQRVAGDYEAARTLEDLAGTTPETAKGKETANELRSWATRTDNNPPSLAQSIPPPMDDETRRLEKGQAIAADSAARLALPRLGMALEAARLARQKDPKTAVAYELLGQDLGALIETPANLNAASLARLTERAVILAGQRSEAARQAEIAAAEQRIRDLARDQPDSAQALAERLDGLSTRSAQAASEASRRQPLASDLDGLARIAPHPADWVEAASAPELAAGAAAESLDGIQAAPKAWESYNEASQTLAEAARRLRMEAALDQLGTLNPFSAPDASTSPDPTANAVAATSSGRLSMDGAAGKALTQPVPAAPDSGDWARLAERLREAIRSSGIEHFTEEQQALIRAYFEKLSSER